MNTLTGTQNLSGLYKTEEKSQAVEGGNDDHSDDDEIIRFINSLLRMVKNDLIAKRSESCACDGLTLSGDGEDELSTKPRPAEYTATVNPNVNSAMKTGCTRKVAMNAKGRSRQRKKSRKQKRSPSQARSGNPNNSGDKTGLTLRGAGHFVSLL